MNKFFPLVMGLLFPLAGALAQDMDKSNEDIIAACSKAKDGVEGTFITYKDGACEYSGCAYVYGATDIKYDGTNQRAKGCGDQSLSSLQKKAKDAKKAEIDAQIAELEKKKKKVAAIGGDGSDGDGKTKVELTDLNGDGVVDDKDRAIYERMLKDAKDGDGYDENGRRVTSDNGTVRIEECNFDLTVDHPCYKKCMRRDGFLGIFGKRNILKLDRKACLKCLAGYGIYPVDGNGKVIGGASIKIKCTTGMVVGANGQCTHPRGGHGGGGSGSGTGSGGTHTHGGGTGTTTVSGSVEVPSYCHSTKKSDKQACEAWIRANARFACSSSHNVQACLGGDYNEVMSRYQYDGCVNCQARGRNGGSTLSGIAEIVGAIAPVGVAALGAHAQIRSAQAWAGAAEVGFQQCTISQNNYLNYLQTNELPGMTPEQQAQQGCNGYGLGGFGGLGGGYGGMYGAGYTPGFVGGMMGPYGGYNPYGGGMAGGAVGGVYTGGYAGGMAAGMAGGMYAGGYAGGYPAGMAGGGGLVNGISLAGGVAAGAYAGGIQGGMYPGGMAGGMYAGGMAGGMYAGGMAGGMYAGGMAGGMYAGGMAGGMYAGGMQGGMYAGGMQGGMYAGGMQGGMYAGGMQGGMQGGMYAGGMQGGYNGGFGGGYGGGYGSGMNNGNNGYYGANQNYYQDYSASMGASNYDRMLQQQGTAYQMGQTASGYGAGSAGYYPQNVGFGLSGSFGMGGGF